MADIVAPETRSKMMSGIRSRDTNPERLLRKALFARGYRYRLNDKNLPGKPDIVFPAYRAVVFVHGCFWHKHECHLFKWPQTRSEFWRKKINGNREHDAIVHARLEALGWRILVVWECAMKGKHRRDFGQLLDSVEGWIVDGKPSGDIAGNRSGATK